MTLTDSVFFAALLVADLTAWTHALLNAVPHL